MTQVSSFLLTTGGCLQVLYGIDRRNSGDDTVQDTHRTRRSARYDVRHPDVPNRLTIDQQNLLAN